jgi:tetratricopeptide (TPR) repeat protein
MKLFVLIFPILLASCASFNNPRQIKQASFDGLKFESLKRYDYTRLNPKLKLKNPLSMCHNQDFEAAHKIFKAQLDAKKDNYLYWNQISTCYILEREYNKAKNFLNLALAAAKTNTQKSIILNNMGVVQLETENFHEAKEYFKKSIELSNKALTPKFNLTQVYLKFGLYRKANDELNFLLTKNPQDIDFLNSKAYLELMQKNYKQALTFFNKIPKEYRSRDDIATNMAMTYFMLGLYDNSKQSLSNADKKDSFYTAKQLEITKELDKKTRK